MRDGLVMDEGTGSGGAVGHFEDGQTIFDEGASGERLFVVQAGRVELSRKGVDGRRVVAIREPGDFFGETGALLGRGSDVRAVAVGETRLIELDRDTLGTICAESPEVGILLIRELARRAQRAEQRLASADLDAIVVPLVRFIERKRSTAGCPDGPVRSSLRELAEGAGLSLCETHHALHQMMERKLLRLVGDELVLPSEGAA
jgi:CRP/FNR family transcriptional regulator